MIKILTDHNCEGQAEQLFFMLKALEYDDLIPATLYTFKQVGLDYAADDETVWLFCQENGYLLLTANRSTADGDTSLEATIRRNYTETILPVLTIGNVKRIMVDRDYCIWCATNLAETMFDLEDSLGVTRIYL